MPITELAVETSAIDGLFVIKPDGKLYVHQGIGNLGTHSVIDTARVVAEVLDYPWDNTSVVWGDTGKGVAWLSINSTAALSCSG